MYKISKIGLAIAGLLLMTGFGGCVSMDRTTTGDSFAQEPVGSLGIFSVIVNDSIAAQKGLKNAGNLVMGVEKGSPAEKGGLLKNDIILKIDGNELENNADLLKMIKENPNKTVTVEGIRGSAPFSLVVTIGVKGKENNMTVTAFDEESAGDQAETDGHSRQAIDHYISALNEYPGDADFRLRQKIITIVLHLKAPPATPEQAERAMVIARAAQANLTDEADCKKAMQKFAEALRYAPWLADPYFNLGVLGEHQEYFGFAAKEFKLYLLAAPDAEDAQKVKERIYLLEDKQKEKEAAINASANAQKAAIETEEEIKSLQLLDISLSVGKISLESSTFHWSDDKTFDRTYDGIEWDPSLHLGIELEFGSYSNPGNSFLFNDAVGILFEKNNSSPSSVMVTNTDPVTKTATTESRDLTGDSFTMTQFIVSDEIMCGYRIILNPTFTCEPFGGFGGQFGIISLSGTEVNDTTCDLMGLRLGFPFGARIYMDHIFLDFEYNYFVKQWYWDMGSEGTHELSVENGSYWAVHVGFTF